MSDLKVLGLVVLAFLLAYGLAHALDWYFEWRANR